MRNLQATLSSLFFGTLFFLIPSYSFAQTASFNYVTNSANEVTGVLVKVVPVLIALALAVFIWGLVVFIQNADNETARTEAKKKMIWGVFGLFVMVSVWGFVYLVKELTGIDGATNGLSAPDVPSS